MKSLRDIISEVKRTPERADKLAQYLVKRETRRDTFNRPNDRYHLPAWHKMGTSEHESSLDDSDHDSDAFERAHSPGGAHRLFYKNTKNVVDVPIKTLLKRNWQGINHSSHYFLNHKMKDERPINIARSRESGKMDIVDGFHRLARNWLLGQTHVKANVQDIGRSKKTK